MGRPFYITTPIYYPNGVPHIGHGYTSVAADFIARYHRLRGDDVMFLNGRDDIYKGSYEGLYCVSCEAYYTEDELVDGMCPIHGRPVERMSEENYFFRLSAYAERLLQHYTRTPSAVEPEVRRNEVLSLIRGGLRDFSISQIGRAS